MPSLYAGHGERTLDARLVTRGTLCEDFPVLYSTCLIAGLPSGRLYAEVGVPH
jgi:hypothetical protein